MSEDVELPAEASAWMNGNGQLKDEVVEEIRSNPALAAALLTRPDLAELEALGATAAHLAVSYHAQARRAVLSHPEGFPEVAALEDSTGRRVDEMAEIHAPKASR